MNFAVSPLTANRAGIALRAAALLKHPLVSSARKTKLVVRGTASRVYAAMRCVMAIAWPAPTQKPVSSPAVVRRLFRAKILQIFVQARSPVTVPAAALIKVRARVARKTMSASLANAMRVIAHRRHVEMQMYKWAKIVTTAT